MRGAYSCLPKHGSIVFKTMAVKRTRYFVLNYKKLFSNVIIYLLAYNDFNQQKFINN